MSKEVADTILTQILAGRGVDGTPGNACMGAWGTHAVRWHEPSQTDKHLGALSFRVQGFLFKGIVKVELAYNDTYRIRLLTKHDGPEIKLLGDVYFDDLTRIIDREVEHPGVTEEARYQQLISQAAYNI